jgi:hypothetical protein
VLYTVILNGCILCIVTKIYHTPLARLTIMVNTVNVSKYSGTPPYEGANNAARKIKGGPLYSKEEIEPLLAGGGSSVIAWTNKCKADLQKESLDVGDVVEFIRVCLRSGKFKGSEWCKQKPTGPWAACDAYQIFVNKWLDTARREMEFEYYVKFAIAKTGRVLMTVSCHGPEERY